MLSKIHPGAGGSGIIYGSNSVLALAKIKEKLPGKAIRYLVLSHHHSDHPGGFREYVAEGATIVTTAGNKSLLENTASTPRCKT